MTLQDLSYDDLLSEIDLLWKNIDYIQKFWTGPANDELINQINYYNYRLSEINSELDYRDLIRQQWSRYGV